MNKFLYRLKDRLIFFFENKHSEILYIVSKKLHKDTTLIGIKLEQNYENCLTFQYV